MTKRLAAVWPLVALAAYYALLGLLIFHPFRLDTAFTGAANEPGSTYGFWSGFGGTLIFSAMVLFPLWYYRQSCHYAFSCLRWGKYAIAGGQAKVCKYHHPDPAGEGETHQQWLARLHRQWQHPLHQVTVNPKDQW